MKNVVTLIATSLMFCHVLMVALTLPLPSEWGEGSRKNEWEMTGIIFVAS